MTAGSFGLKGPKPWEAMGRVRKKNKEAAAANLAGSAEKVGTAKRTDVYCPMRVDPARQFMFHSILLLSGT